MQLHRVDEDQISDLGMVQLALHPVLHLAAEKEVNLKKVVVMYLHVRQTLIPVMEDFVIRPAHTLPRIK